ncbi:MAG: hypothetical protein JST13_05720 [Bacteroidetes bacterium]|nr:hypothetical protein [Bacteroidota bacterium]
MNEKIKAWGYSVTMGVIILNLINSTFVKNERANSTVGCFSLSIITIGFFILVAYIIKPKWFKKKYSNTSDYEKL